jgi:hypothetical protein
MGHVRTHGKPLRGVRHPRFHFNTSHFSSPPRTSLYTSWNPLQRLHFSLAGCAVVSWVAPAIPEPNPADVMKFDVQVSSIPAQFLFFTFVHSYVHHDFTPHAVHAASVAILNLPCSDRRVAA